MKIQEGPELSEMLSRSVRPSRSMWALPNEVSPSSRAWLAVLILFVGACDPGARYVPAGWDKAPDDQWSLVWEDIHFEIHSVGGLTASGTLHPEFGISNESASTFRVRAAAILSADGRYSGRVIGSDAIEAGKEGRLILSLELGDTGIGDLGEAFTLELSVEHGSESDVLEFKFLRSEAPWGYDS